MRASDKLETNDELVQAPPKYDILLQNEHFCFPDEVECIRLYADWEIRNVGINCELDLVVYCADDRVSLNTDSEVKFISRISHAIYVMLLIDDTITALFTTQTA